MPLLNILFWNVQKKDLTAQIVNLAKGRDVDILVLAENLVSSVQLTQALNTNGPDYFLNHPLSQCKKLTIITRFPYDLIVPIEESHRLTTRHVQLITGEEFLLTALHLVDKGNFTAESQSEAASEIANQLYQTEIRVGINRHIVLGDFNMNPFETGMIKANGFHGTMSSEVALQESRTVQKREYPYFYNPTWSLFGDLNKDTSGTYYYRHAEHICYEWNVFDQVLLRPGLIANFVKDSLEIVQHDSVTSLITAKKIPDATNHSDHLPLFFTLKF
jgi:exonuclease III